jgi:tripartite-type tricarboxylate transporter receptor subunit TctC
VNFAPDGLRFTKEEVDGILWGKTPERSLTCNLKNCQRIKTRRRQGTVKINKAKVLFLSMMFIAAGLTFTESTPSQSLPGNYPAGKPITMIVPWPAGGATDVTARALAAGLEKELKTPIQIINKGGANSQVGMTAVLTAKADGYTLGFVSLPTCVTHYLDPSREAPYTRKNFEPIACQWQAPLQ